MNNDGHLADRKSQRRSDIRVDRFLRPDRLLGSGCPSQACRLGSGHEPGLHQLTRQDLRPPDSHSLRYGRHLQDDHIHVPPPSAHPSRQASFLRSCSVWESRLQLRHHTESMQRVSRLELVVFFGYHSLWRFVATKRTPQLISKPIPPGEITPSSASTAATPPIGKPYPQ